MIAYTEKQLFLRDETELPRCLAASLPTGTTTQKVFHVGYFDVSMMLSSLLACQAQSGAPLSINITQMVHFK